MDAAPRMRHLPGDRRVKTVDTASMIRVDQAGEYGAAADLRRAARGDGRPGAHGG